MLLYENRSKGLFDSPYQRSVSINFQICVSIVVNYRADREALIGVIDIVIHLLPYLAIFKDKPGIGYPAGKLIDDAAFK